VPPLPGSIFLHDTVRRSRSYQLLGISLAYQAVTDDHDSSVNVAVLPSEILAMHLWR
jgi:hypothetical protein